MMKNEYDNLKEAISLLKKRKRIERALLKEHFQDVHESLKPLNFIKGIFNSMTEDSAGKKSLIDNVLGIATGYLSKKLFIGGSHNLFKNIFGVLMQVGVQKAVVNNADSIKIFSESILKSIFNKNSKKPMSESMN